MKQSLKYHKIPSVYKRADDHSFMLGDWSIPEFDYLKNNDWVFTEKIDGMNIRIMWDGKEVTFAGRSDDAMIPTPLLLKLNELFKSFDAIKQFEESFGIYNGIDDISICLYGEGYGAKIQKGGGNYKSDGNDFVLFDVQINRTYLERYNIEDIAKKFNLRAVPIIGHGTIAEAIEMTRKGFKSQWGDFIAEGIVLRPRVELLSRRGERIITKVKYKDFN